MKYLVFLALVGQALSLQPILLNYHSNVGIPEAARIKAAEERLDFSGSRIVGGSLASVGDYPYFGGLLISLQTGGVSVCGSSLLSHTRLVTAAHCWNDGFNSAASIVAVLGSVALFSGGERVGVTGGALHPAYNPNTLGNDVAVLSIPWTNYTNVIQPIQLPEGYLMLLTFAGNTVQAAGFGRTGDGADGGITTAQVLSHVSLRVMSNMVCRDTFGAAILDSMLCTSGEDRRSTCAGDSGGPLALVINGQAYLVGITSFTAAAGCEAGMPAGFGRVTSFVEWISQMM